MIPGIAPAISKKKADDPGGGYSFTMTAGSFMSQAFGYIPGFFGDIDVEPLPNNPIAALAYDSTGIIMGQIGTSIAFTGDVESLLSGKVLHVDSVPYAAGFSGWIYFPDFGTTEGTWSSNYPTFAATNQYFIEIK